MDTATRLNLAAIRRNPGLSLRDRRITSNKREQSSRLGEQTAVIASSGACEWLLTQYDKIDRKFPIVNTDRKQRAGNPLQTKSA